MPTLEDLVVGIAADVQRATRNMDRFERDFAKVTSQVQRNNRRIESNFQRMSRNVTRAMRGILPVLSGAALVQGARRAIDYADAIGVASDRLGVGVEFLQEFRFAAEDSSNVLATQADTALQRFTRRVGEAAQGTGELQGVLDQYGIAVRDSDGATRAIGDVLADYADAVAGAESSQEQLRLAFKAFDSEGAALVNLLREGGEGWERYAEAAREAGILNDQQIREAQELDSQLTRLSQTLNTTLAEAFIDLGPVIQGFVTTLAAAARFVGDTFERIDRTLAQFGLSDGPSANIQTLLDAIPEIRELGSGASMTGGQDRVAAFRDIMRESEEFRDAVRSNDIPGMVGSIEEYARAQNALRSLTAPDLGTIAPVGGGGGGGGGAAGVLEQFERQTAAIWGQVDAASRLTEVERERVHLGNDLRMALAEEGLLTNENRDAIELLVNARQDAVTALRDQEVAVDLINDAIGDLPVSAEAGQIALDNFALVADSLGLTADETAAALERLESQIAGEGVSDALIDMDQLGQQAGQTIAGGLESAITQAESLQEALAGVLEALARIVLQQAVLGPLGDVIGTAIGSIGGGIGGSIGGGVQVGSNHMGGLAGSGAVRTVMPSVFDGAPRYHNGGIAGLAPNDVPSILQRDEEILTTRDPRHRFNGGAGGGITINQTISIEAQAVNENGVDPAAADAAGRQMRQAVRSAVQQEIAQQSRVGGMLNKV